MEKNIDYGTLKALSTAQLAMLTWRHKNEWVCSLSGQTDNTFLMNN